MLSWDEAVGDNFQCLFRVCRTKVVTWMINLEDMKDEDLLDGGINKSDSDN